MACMALDERCALAGERIGQVGGLASVRGGAHDPAHEAVRNGQVIVRRTQETKEFIESALSRALVAGPAEVPLPDDSRSISCLLQSLRERGLVDRQPLPFRMAV